MAQPERIGRYRIVGVLGVGGFATVYRARDDALDVTVAIKVLAENWAYDEDVRRRFIQEAQLLRRVDGTRVVRVHDIGQDETNGLPYFVMDFADGGTVADRIDDLRADDVALGIDDVLAFARQLAAGVAEVHSLGVVHRDLKPGNLLLRSFGDPGGELPDAPMLIEPGERMVIADLGLAKSTAAASALTAIVGTPGYMAPEQQDPAATLTPAADLYACSAIVHRLLTGDDPTPLTERGQPGQAPHEVTEFLARGFAPDPAQRYQHAAEWLDGFERALDTVDRGWTARPGVDPLVASISQLTRSSGRSAPPPPSFVAATPPPVAPPGNTARRPLLIAAGILSVLTVIAAVAVFTRAGDDGPGEVGSDSTVPGGTGSAAGIGGIAAGDPATTVPAGDIILFDPIAVDQRNGVTVIAEISSHRVTRLDADGTVTTIAGTGLAGFSGDGGPATQAQLFNPTGLSIADDGSVFVADQGNRRIRLIRPDGTIVTIAGTGTRGGVGDGGPAIDAQLVPTDVVAQPDGGILVADSGSGRIRRVDPEGIITTVAGNGTAGFSGDGGPAVEAALFSPIAIADAPDGTIYISDSGNGRIRRVDPDGTIHTHAGTGERGETLPTGVATEAALGLPDGLSVAADGSLLVADGGLHAILRVDADGEITTVVGTGTPGDAGDGSTTLREPSGVDAQDDGSILFADVGNNRIRRIATDGTTTDIAGGGAPGSLGDNNPATAVPLVEPAGLGFGTDGSLYFVESGTSRIRRVDPDGIIRPIEFTGISTDGIDATLTAELFGGTDIAVDAADGIYVGESLSSRVRLITTDRVFLQLAGTGSAGFSGDGGPPLQAQLNQPTGLAFGAESLFVVDSANGRIREISVVPLEVSTFAGTDPSRAGTTPNDTPLETAMLLPFDAVATVDGLYVTENVGMLVRFFGFDGTVDVVAGNGSPGSSGDGGPATLGQLNEPQGIALRDRTLFVAENAGHRIRAIDLDSGVMTTLAGTGSAGFGGDEGPATDAQLDRPTYLAVGPDGALHVSDSGNGRIRRIDPDTGVITTVAGGFS